MPEISVIVPVYRAESFLRKCTDSILNQTFQDLELLLIDDGSPDHSGALCDQIAKEDPRVRVFHKDNGGVSSARNLGMTQANGQYFAFADSDDWLPPDALETLYTALTAAGADTAGGGHWRVWRFLFSRSVIQNHGMHFLGAYLEDELFLLEYFCYANKLAMTDKAVYHYLQNPDSVTRRYLPDYMQTFHTFMKAKEALAQRLELGRDQPLWRENSCWAGLLIAVGNEFAASNAAPLAEKRRRVRGICQLPEMASAIRQIHPEGLGRNKQIVADLIRRRQYFALSMLYGLKNRKG